MSEWKVDKEYGGYIKVITDGVNTVHAHITDDMYEDRNEAETNHSIDILIGCCRQQLKEKLERAEDE